MRMTAEEVKLNYITLAIEGVGGDRKFIRKLGESVVNFACGTGGYLTSTLKYFEPQHRS